MTNRRPRGEGGISFEHRGPCRDSERHRHCPGRWRGEVTLGFTPEGTRNRSRVTGRTKTEVQEKLKALHADLDRGITPKGGYSAYTVRQAAEDWLKQGLDGRAASQRGMATEEIGRLVGHSSSRTTEVVYRHELRPVIRSGAEIMNKIFKG